MAKEFEIGPHIRPEDRDMLDEAYKRLNAERAERIQKESERSRSMPISQNQKAPERTSPIPGGARSFPDVG